MGEDFKKKMQEISKTLEKSKADIENAQKYPIKSQLESLKKNFDIAFDNLRLTLLPVTETYPRISDQYPDVKRDVEVIIKELQDQLGVIAKNLMQMQEQIQGMAYTVQKVTDALVDSVKQRYNVDL
ncbi:MAG: hypothetical protein ACTSVI_13605 [Promethearchaeota archaeon]